MYESPLHTAAWYGDKAAVALSLQRGTDIDAKRKISVHENWTALMAAAVMNRPEVVDLLLRGGADIHAKNNEGQTALILARTDQIKALLIKVRRGWRGQDHSARGSR